MRQAQVTIAGSPFTLAQMKEHLRVDHSDEDTLIQSYYAAATQRIQNWTRRSIGQEQWQMILDGFPADDERVFLPRGKVQSVGSVVYADSATTTATLSGATASPAGTDYQESLGSDVAPYLLPAYGTSWPSTFDVIEPVVITFTAGYADLDASPLNVSAVPEELLEAVRVQAADFYERRSSDDIENRNTHAAHMLANPFVLPIW